eukprot:gb/GECG01013664.1/.p1 GENE.gb/GECG01013664.1/~~gb/GECG01013664.1/.p1  ORF type:complete len:497 (+),score=88.10 gb/GECG01013664.1/:1-1491(+)
MSAAESSTAASSGAGTGTSTSASHTEGSSARSSSSSKHQQQQSQGASSQRQQHEEEYASSRTNSGREASEPATVTTQSYDAKSSFHEHGSGGASGGASPTRSSWGANRATSSNNNTGGGQSPDHTFLTGVKSEERNIEIPEPQSMHRVRKMQERVQGVVNTLNEKVSRVLQIQEKEFLEAYRGHMYTVQRELKMWQQKADEEAAKALRDAKVKRLEEECAWFRAESLRLDKYTNAMKKDLESMREKVNALEEDRSWLEKQLKNTTKDNKVLRSELENTVSEKRNIEEQTLKQQQQQQVASYGTQEDYSAKIPSALPAIGNSGSGTDLKSTQSQAQSQRSSERPQSESQRTSALQSRIEDLEAELSRCKTNLARERERVQELRQMSSHRSERTELEQFFQSCIDAVRSHIDARNSREGTDSPDVPEGSFSHFTTSDRRAVVMRLLEDDNVLETLHAVIFGHISTKPSDRSKGSNSKSPDRGRSSWNNQPSPSRSQRS